MSLTAVQIGFDSRADENLSILEGRTSWPEKTC